MKVKCLANTGEGFSEYTMAHMGCSIHTNLPLHINETYVVYGQMLSKGILKYLIKGTDENLPSWYPAELFEVVDPLFYMECYFNYNSGDELSAIWGFQELATNKQFLYDLIEREDYAVRIFLERKKEFDAYNEDAGTVNVSPLQE